MIVVFSFSDSKIFLVFLFWRQFANTVSSDIPAGTARPMWNGGRKWRQPFSCKPKRGTGSPVSAANGTPFAMLAGLSDRLPHRRFVRFFSLWYIPQLAPRCATIAFNASGGVTILFSFWGRQTRGFLRVFRIIVPYTVTAMIIIAKKRRHLLYYNYQVIYIFLLCIKYILSCILNI